MSSIATMARPNVLRRSGSWRLPVWGPPLLLLLAAVIGLLFAIPMGSIGLPYLIVFLLAAIAGIILVVPRGLFVTVAQLPLLFTILTPIVAWFTASFADPAVGGALDSTPRRTRVITAAYPIIQYFPWIAAITLIALAIAVWRYLEVTRRNAKVEKISRKEKRKLQRAEESTTRSATKARRRVAESDARRSRHGADAAGTRPAADIIRDAEERRKRLAERSRRRQAGADAAGAAGAGAGAAAGRRAGASAGARVVAGSPPPRPRPGERPEGPRPEERPARLTADQRRRVAAAEQSRRSAYRPDRLATRRVADDRREAPRGASRRDGEPVRGSQPRRQEQPIRREPVAGRRPADAGRSEPQRRVQEWPPRHERPRHSPRDADDRGRDPRDPRDMRGRDPREPRRGARDARGYRDAGPRRRVEDLDFGDRRVNRDHRRDDRRDGRRGYDDRRDPRRR